MQLRKSLGTSHRFAIAEGVSAHAGYNWFLPQHRVGRGNSFVVARQSDRKFRPRGIVRRGVSPIVAKMIRLDMSTWLDRTSGCGSRSLPIVDIDRLPLAPRSTVVGQATITKKLSALTSRERKSFLAEEAKQTRADPRRGSILGNSAEPDARR